MTRITIVLNKETLIETLKKLDNAKEYGDKESYWLEYDIDINEMYFEDGKLVINIPSDERAIEPSIFMCVSIPEVLEQFERFDFAEKINEYAFKTQVQTKKIFGLMNKLKAEREKEATKRLKSRKKAKEEK